MTEMASALSDNGGLYFIKATEISGTVFVKKQAYNVSKCKAWFPFADKTMRGAYGHQARGQ